MNEDIKIEEVAPWLVVFLTLVGFGVRVLMLDRKGMWLDETFSVWLANHSVREMLQWVVKVDQHPPLYYLLLNSWVAQNGDAARDVRMLSVLFGAGTIPIIYLTGKRMSGVLAGLAAAVFLALSPFNIRFAQETRMYTLLAFNAAVAIYALVRLLTDTRTTRPIGSQLKITGIRTANMIRTASGAFLNLGGSCADSVRTKKSGSVPSICKRSRGPYKSSASPNFKVISRRLLR